MDIDLFAYGMVVILGVWCCYLAYDILVGGFRK